MRSDLHLAIDATDTAVDMPHVWRRQSDGEIRCAFTMPNGVTVTGEPRTVRTFIESFLAAADEAVRRADTLTDEPHQAAGVA